MPSKALTDTGALVAGSMHRPKCCHSSAMNRTAHLHVRCLTSPIRHIHSPTLYNKPGETSILVKTSPTTSARNRCIRLKSAYDWVAT